MTDTTADRLRLEDVIGDLLDLKWRMNPSAATALGIHIYDDTLGDCSPDAFGRLAAEFRACRNTLQSQVDPTRLDPDDHCNYELAMSLASSSIIRLERLRDWERDPSFYPQRAMWGIHGLLAWEFPPDEIRAQSILNRMRELPGLLDLARKNLIGASTLLTRIGIEATEQCIAFLNGAASDLPDANGQCISALESYRAWLEDDLMPTTRTDFAIGAELYKQLLFSEHLLTSEPGSIERLAAGSLINAQNELSEIASGIDRSASWQEIVQRLTADHPAAEELLSEYTDAIRQSKEFVRVERLVTMPEDDLLTLAPTPESLCAMFPRTAYIPPPPFEEDRRHGHFWVTLVDQTSSHQERERLLQEHSRYSIPIAALHGSYPGHHLQFSTGNRVGSPIVKQAMSHLFVEGWALYCEEMMYEQGFYSDPRVRLFQLRDSVRYACRALVDVGLQTGDMSFHEAVGLLVATAGMDEAAAITQVRRLLREPTRGMTSTIGKVLVLGIREEQKRRLGSRFDLRAFHDQLVSYGTIPTPLIAERFALDVAS